MHVLNFINHIFSILFLICGIGCLHIAIQLYIVEKVEPSVVSVNTVRIAQDSFLRPVPVQGMGSGIIIDSLGHILTNYLPSMGVIIIRIESYGPADKAELIVGDVISEIEGEKIESIEDLRSKLKNKKVTDRINVIFYRGHKRYRAELFLESN
ncbi:MAG: Trypsin-like serine protease [Thermoproteota archaeon]|nr:Trypsin-like serine protease [Thermoproteota archaeon]